MLSGERQRHGEPGNAGAGQKADLPVSIPMVMD
jgi:hypothetical protein